MPARPPDARCPEHQPTDAETRPARSKAPPINFLDYLADPFTRDVLLELSIQHALLTLVPVVVAAVLGVLFGITAHRFRYSRPAILNTASVFLTIPSLALFGLMIGVVGIGNTPVIIALTMYALLPIIRNTLSGLNSVDKSIVESARGMGMTNLQRLWKIELPLAWPVILAGLRVATQLTVGIAAVAALIGGDGLGNEIYSQGIRRIGSPGAVNAILGGTLGILILAALFDGAYQLLGRVTTSKGIQ